MLEKKTSVLIVSGDGNPNKKVQIPTFLLSYWKHLVFSFVAFMLLGVVGIVYLVNHRNEKLYADVYLEKIDQLRKKNQQLSLEEATNQTNINDVRRSLNSVDSTLNRINAKMRKRGLKAIAMNNAGGPVVEEEENLEELAKFYVNMLADVESRLDGAPFGRPHHGRVTSRYGYRRNPFTGRGREMHSGVDLKGRTGEPIKSTARGTVTFAGYQRGYGNLVTVRHANGYETKYGHLSRIRVKRGQRVDVGATVGLLGSTGRSTGPHLHYEVLLSGRTLNPEKYFQF
ncbi:M23 family metallopeptidase [Sphingobacterium corticis]|uniref:M23 family metallopeptidase n=1 Tax=Sphingobacterium corticis TaxID=1812823 RepID=A0ABW5NFR6_9SPHI